MTYKRRFVEDDIIAEKSIKEFDIKKLEKKIRKFSIQDSIKLIKWLYDNHRDILREWEATQGKLRIEFL